MLTHHAYYIEDSLARFGEYKAALHPLWASAFERFGIDEARELIALASLKNFDAATFLVGAASITTEAQQALLKLLEEPQEGTTFVFLIPHGALLPTVKSRMLEYPGKSREPGRQNGLASPATELKADLQDEEIRGPFDGQVTDFLSASGKERSDLITKILKDDEGLKERVRDFLNALEAALAPQAKKSAQVRQALEDIAMAREYLADRSPSVKMLLEHLALSIPKV